MPIDYSYRDPIFQADPARYAAALADFHGLPKSTGLAREGPSPTSNDVTTLINQFRNNQIDAQTLYEGLVRIGYTTELAKHVTDSEVTTRTQAAPQGTTPGGTTGLPGGQTGSASPGLGGDAGGNEYLTTIPGGEAFNPGQDVSFEEATPFKNFLERTEQGRQALFGTAIRGQYPQTNPFSNYLESRFEPTQQQYILEQGVGSPLSGQGFSDYATGAGQRSLSPDLWKAYLQTASSLLQTPPSNITKQQSDFREYLNDPKEGGGRQFDLALQSYLPGVASPFYNSVSNAARRSYQDLTVNDPKQSFLPWYVRRGQRFF